jgi:hypothetical protein
MKLFNRFLAFGLFVLALYELFVWSDKTGLGIILAIVLGCLGYVVWIMPPTSNASADSMGLRSIKFDRTKFTKGLVVGAKVLIFGLLVMGIVSGVGYLNSMANVKSLTVSDARYEKDPYCDKGTEYSQLVCANLGTPMRITAILHNNGSHTLHSVRGRILFLKDGQPYATTKTTWITTGSIVRGGDFQTYIRDDNMDEVVATDNGTHLGWLKNFMANQIPFEIKMETAIRN